MKVADIYTQSERVYIRTGEPATFEYSDGDKQEIYLLEVIKNAQDLSTTSDELAGYIRDWTTCYHLSPQRSNLFRPFSNFFYNKTILEPGAGCGAITRLLGESGAMVTAVEGSVRRATIAAERCRDLQNVTVVCDNFDMFESKERFDIVILTGVLEYSNLFVKGEDPAGKLLSKVRLLLKEDGVLLLAIENKLGLKYWAGIPEDHTGVPYYGIENRYTGDTAVTYGRTELKSMLCNSGFNEQDFYFPFPDYKLPAVILNEKSFTIPGFNINNLLLPVHDYSQTLYTPSFSVHRAWREAIRNKMVPELANSFLVVAGTPAQQVIDKDILGYTYSTGRRSIYSKENLFREHDNSGIIIERRSLQQFSAQQNEQLIQHIEQEEYQQGDMYFLQLMDLVTTDQWNLEQITAWMKPYHNLLVKLAITKDDRLVLPGKYLDLTPFNILIDPEGQLVFFDQEWEVREDLPLTYILARGLYYSLAKIIGYSSPADGTPLFSFDIVEQVIQQLLPVQGAIPEEFVCLESRYIQHISPQRHYIPRNFLLPLIAQQNVTSRHAMKEGAILPLSTMQAKVFVQTDTMPFSEENAVNQLVQLTSQQQSYTIGINNPGDVIQKIRIDPAEQTGIVGFYSLSVADELGNILIDWNGEGNEYIDLQDMVVIPLTAGLQAFLLLSDDPQIVITLPGPGTSSNSIHVTLNMVIVENSELTSLGTGIDKLLNLFVYMQYEGKTGIKMSYARGSALRSLIDRFTEQSAKVIHNKLKQAEQVAEEQAALTEILQHRVVVLEESKLKADKLDAENEMLRKNLDWYKSTYEERSFAGVIKDRIKNKLVRSYMNMVNWLLSSRVIQDKYAATYLLQYIRNYGIRNFFRAAVRATRKHGFKTFTDTKAIVLGKWRRSVTRTAAMQQGAVKQEWISITQMQEEIRLFQQQPLISIILPTYNTRPDLLQMAVDSVRKQVYDNWELCIADDGSSSRATITALESLQDDKRIKISLLPRNAGISAASNAALRLAIGEYVALLDHDDELTPDALYWIVKEVNAHAAIDIIYTDECKVDENGELSDYFLKPDWSPELLFNMMYTGHLTVYRKQFIDRIGPFRTQYDFSQDYDLMLRASEQTRHIHHIPKVLYHWRITEGSTTAGDKPYARNSNLAALADAVQRRNIEANVVALPTANRVQWRWKERPSVSLIVPTDSFDNLRNTIDSVLNRTTYGNYEIVAVTNSGLIAEMQQIIQSSRVVYIPYDKPYNFSDKCNQGAIHANNEIIIFFNDDVRPLQPDWIEHTIEFLALPGVGGVSPRLVYENNTIQYAGMAVGVRNLVGTTFHAYPKDSTSYFNFPQLVRNVTVLSGACLAIRKSLYMEIDGFDEVNTPSSHSDVDLSFKILDKGLRCMYTPYATLLHIGHLSLHEHEKKAKKTKKDKADIYLLKRWIHYLGHDPYFTTSMKQLLYHDSPEPYTIYTPLVPASWGNMGDVLLVSHDLSLSGAPIVLYQACQLLLQNGYFVTVIAPVDGPVRKMYQQLGVTVIVDALALNRHDSFYRFAKNFDLLIANTVAAWPVIQQMQSIMDTIWWIHEGQVIRQFARDPEFVRTLRMAKNLLTVSDYAGKYIDEYNPVYHKIYNACADFYTPEVIVNNGQQKIIISIIGSVEPRKGQKVLIDALGQLPDELRAQVEVRIIGRAHDLVYKEEIDKKALNYSNVICLPEVSHEECLEYMHQSDIIVNASADDPFPISLVEAFCLGKACIVSTNTGFAELIVHGKNGLVFESGQPVKLAQCMHVLLQNHAAMASMAAEARKTYEACLQITSLENELLHYVGNIMLSTKNRVSNRKTAVYEN